MRFKRATLLVALSCAALMFAEEDETTASDDLLDPSEALSSEQQKRLDLVNHYLNRDPMPLIEGNRLTYLYGEGQPSLICAPFRICTLALSPGERIAKNGLLIGAATEWHVVHVYVAGNDAVHIALKPKNAGLRTSLSILTTGVGARYYHVDLISDPKAYMPLVAFRYEAQALDDINTMVETAQGTVDISSSAEHLEYALPNDYGDVSLDDLNFAYELSGCRTCPWRPERVFDDGTRTIIVLPAESTTAPLPVLFVVGRDSDAQISNTHFNDPSIIVDGLFDEARLRLGVGRPQEEVSIRRKPK